MKEQIKLTQLVVSSQKGKQKAITDLYDQTKNYAYSVARQYVPQDDIADVVQEAYIAVFQHLKTFDTTKGFMPWLHSIVRNKSIDHIKRNNFLSFNELDELENLEDEGILPSGLIEKEEKRKDILKIINSLSVGQKTAITLFYLEGFSIREIAHDLDITEGAVKKQLHLARQAIKKAVLQEEQEHDNKLYGVGALPMLTKLLKSEVEDGLYTMPAAMSTEVLAGVTTAITASGVISTGGMKGVLSSAFASKVTISIAAIFGIGLVAVAGYSLIPKADKDIPVIESISSAASEINSSAEVQENLNDQSIQPTPENLLNGGYDKIFSLGEEMFAVIKDDKYGLADYSGNLILPIEYEAIYEFKDGISSAKKDGLFGAINIQGEVIVPFEYNTLYDFSSGVACVQQNGKWGFVDTKGNVVVPLTYDGAYSMIEGIAPVRQGNMWGYINSSNKIIYPFEAYEAWPINDGLAMLKKSGGSYAEDGYYIIDIDATGKEVTNTKYSNMAQRYRYSDGVALLNDPNGLQVVDLQGNKTPIKGYQKWDWYKNGLCKVTDYSGLVGFIDKTGKEVIPCQYQEASNFRNGYAYVGNNGLYGMIDASGNLVIPMEIENYSSIKNDGIGTYKINGEWFIFDAKAQ
ncbi:MAG: sigma-70 family RNA polymerase sigma factor [Angelakisella sp.]|nr:sigma-70 family RNA polymerase sigma factor [Angelakisella sp.]